MQKIYISAGHTSADPGKVFQDLKEAELTRVLARYAMEYLNSISYNAIAVPLDLFVWQRIDWVNNHAGTEAAKSLLIEFHVNDGAGDGLEAWYKGEGGNESQKLGYSILQHVKSKLGYEYKLSSEREHKLGQLSFLTRSETIPVLVEALYIDNPKNIQDLKSEAKLRALAKEVVVGALWYLGLDETGKQSATITKPDFSGLKPYVKPPEPTIPDTDFNPFADFNTDLPDSFDLSNQFNNLNMPAPTASQPIFMDKKQRETMVTQVYEKLLGHAPSPQDLTFFVNQGITKDQLVDKIVDSQEHQDLILAKAKLESQDALLNDLKSKLTRLQAQLNDTNLLNAQINLSTQQRNARIKELELYIQNLTKLPAPGFNDKSLSSGSGSLPPASGVKVKSKQSSMWKFLVKKLS